MLPTVRNPVGKSDNRDVFRSVEIRIRFEEHGANVPVLRGDLTHVYSGCRYYSSGKVMSVYGCDPGDHEVLFTNWVNTQGGGDDLFYDPIPANLFEVRNPSPNAVVTVNGYTAECSTNRAFSDESYDVYDESLSDCFLPNTYYTPNMATTGSSNEASLRDLCSRSLMTPI